jgi:hypothetical protein
MRVSVIYGTCPSSPENANPVCYAPWIKLPLLLLFNCIIVGWSL